MPTKTRPGDQPLPEPTDGPSMHDMVAAEIWFRHPESEVTPGLLDMLAQRRAIGLERYGQLLQANNGRNAPQDLEEELLDASVYARQNMEEAPDPAILDRWASIYSDILDSLVAVAALRAELARP